ncbi:hypothetical protein KVV02_006422 [Mortierella alpina]|uniref:Lipase n=1 Tax=Mortierella alpina TaxID=64518 RepID=A0A9P8D3J1_MORAP|nr:hypothetical protein KVV02_006422 [Mortierella alpina]
MRTSGALAALTLAFLSVLQSSVQASPLPSEATDGHVPSLAESILLSNDWSCKLSSDRPRPLILVHGIFGSIQSHMPFMISFFQSQGYCVFALDHGALHLPFIFGLDKFENSAQQLSAFTEQVLKATGASKVDLVSYSAGTLVCQYYMKRLHGASSVEKHAAISPVHYGTTLWGVQTLAKTFGLLDIASKTIGQECISCFQVLVNSTFLRDLYADGDAVPGIQYLMVTTVTDEVVTPYTNGFLRSPSPDVRNQLLQDWCPNDLTEHNLLRADVNVFNEIDAFLTSSNRALACRDPPLWIPPII